MSYTKLFSHIVTSSIWSEDDQTRILWITMLALSDKHGEVMASVPGLAKVAGLSIEATQKGLVKFLSPDPYSRTPDEEGRRIEEIDGGWLVLNYAKHRRMASVEDEKAKNAARQKRHREKKKSNAKVTDSSQGSNGSVTVQTDNAEAEASLRKLDAVTESHLVQWRGLFKPLGVDVDREVGKAKAWIAANKGRRFTSKFMLGWLNRTADRSKKPEPVVEHEPVGEGITMEAWRKGA